MNKIEDITILQTTNIPKGWGKEIVIVNNDKYCGKLLCFNKGAKFSMHYHWDKHETWLVVTGKLLLTTYNLANSEKSSRIIEKGNVVTIPPGNPHQLEALEESQIFEVSTTHHEEDSYRILPGDSQKK